MFDPSSVYKTTSAGMVIKVHAKILASNAVPNQTFRILFQISLADPATLSRTELWYLIHIGRRDLEKILTDTC